ncbi:ABC transporter substrate-binding protein [Rhodococcus koreensis]
MKVFSRRSCYVLAAVSVTALVAACGSDISDDAAGLSGDPVKLLVIAPTDTQVTNFPDVPAGARASVRAINADGGINGRPVEVDYCNDKGDPASGDACARQAVDGGYVAVVGLASPVSSARIVDRLQGAGIPSVSGSPINATVYNSPIAYNVDGGATAIFPVCGEILKEAGAEVHGIARYDAESTAAVIPQLQAGVAHAGLQDSGLNIAVPSTATDYSAIAQRLTSANVDGITVLMPEGQTVQLIKALESQGSDAKICVSDYLFPESSQKALGAVAENVYAAGFMPMSNDSDPNVQEFLADLQAQADAGDKAAERSALTSGTYRGWVGPKIVAEVARGIDGEINADTLREAINQQNAVDAKMFGTIDFTQHGPVFPAVRNMTAYKMKWDAASGERVLLSPEPVDTSSFVS